MRAGAPAHGDASLFGGGERPQRLTQVPDAQRGIECLDLRRILTGLEPGELDELGE